MKLTKRNGYDQWRDGMGEVQQLTMDAVTFGISTVENKALG